MVLIPLHQYQSGCEEQNQQSHSQMNETCNLPSSSSLYHHPSFPFTESVREVGFIILVNEIVEPRLTTELVDSLSDLVPCGIAQSRE